MIISRRFAAENKWTVESMLEFINEEISARERCVPLEKRKRDHNPRIERFTTECLLGEAVRENSCIYCGDPHVPWKCTNITNVQTRENEDAVIYVYKQVICQRTVVQIICAENAENAIIFLFV